MSFFEEVIKHHKKGDDIERNQKAKKWMQEVVSSDNIERAKTLIMEDIEKE